MFEYCVFNTRDIVDATRAKKADQVVVRETAAFYLALLRHSVADENAGRMKFTNPLIVSMRSCFGVPSDMQGNADHVCGKCFACAKIGACLWRIFKYGYCSAVQIAVR